MRNLKYFVVVCLAVLCVSCGSRSGNMRFVEDENSERRVLANSILSYLQQEQFDKIVAHFDNNLRMQISKEQLAVIWAQLNVQFGEFSGGEYFITETIANVGEKVIYTTTFGGQRLFFELVFGRDNQIIGIFFRP